MDNGYSTVEHSRLYIFYLFRFGWLVGIQLIQH